MVDLKKALAKSEEEIHLLRSKIEELQDFIENAALPLHWVNGSGIIIWANQVELDILGYSKDEYVGKHISHFHADKKIIEDILTRLVNKETLKNYPARLKCKNGDIKHVLINSNVLWIDNNFVHTRCFTRDVTELKKLEQTRADVIAELQEKNTLLTAELKALKKTFTPS